MNKRIKYFIINLLLTTIIFLLSLILHYFQVFADLTRSQIIDGYLIIIVPSIIVGAILIYVDAPATKK